MSTHRMSALAAGTSLAIATATGGAGGAADDPGTSDPWVTLTEDGYHRFAVPHSAVREALGAEPVTVEVSGTFGPAGTWADLATELQGGEHVASTLLTPGLHVFTYTATLVDRTRVTFREPTQPQPVTSDDTLATIFVAGEGVDWFADSPEPGPVEEVTYRVGESDRTAFVWRPHGVSGALPTLFLLADEAHSAREWLELGRAAQVLDRLHTDGGLTPMQVVMARVDDAAEVTRDLAPALGVELTDGAPALAAAGIGTGAAHALELARDTRLAALGLMSARLDGARPGLSAEDAPDLVRVYVGNSLDPAYDPTLELLAALDGVPHEFDGVTPGSGGTWDTWCSALRDLASRAFQDAVVGGPREGHPLLEAPYSPPEDVTTPHVDEHGIVTFVTGTQWAEAHEVRVWGNWAPHGAWYRIPMERDGDRWRLRIGPLDGFYYYRYVVDGVDHKDPADTVNTLTGVSPLFVPGETDRLLADVPAGQGGALEVLTYSSTVAPGERKAYVWTPPGYDPGRAEPYPLLILNHGGDQSWGDWVEVGRARQIFDNLSLAGELVPMVVVMGDGNVSDYESELLDNLMPAVEEAFHVARDADRRAIAGLSMGAMHTLRTWLTHPGEFAWVGAFSGFLFTNPDFDAEQVNATTRLARIYTGDSADFTYEGTLGLMAMLDERGVRYEFPGATRSPHGFDTWQANLIDLAPRLFVGVDGTSPTSESPPAPEEPADDDAPQATRTGSPGAWPGIVAGLALLLAAGVGWGVTRRRRS